MPLSPGTPAPWFQAATPFRPDFAFSSVAGRYVLAAFLPQEAPALSDAIRDLIARKPLFDGARRFAVGIVRDAEVFAGLQDLQPGLTWFHDPDGRIAQAFSLLTPEGDTVPQWVLIDPMLRVIFSVPFDEEARVFEAVGRHIDPDRHAGVPIHAPVLIVPRIFEPAVCRRLIDYYEAEGGQVSGIMREVDGMTVPVVDGFKKRRDANVVDANLQAALRQRVMTRLLPEIEKVFQFKATRMERYIVARYDAKDGGYFRPHRDNTTKGTAHRKFACSINLNAEDFEGGDLRFPEFGSRTYRPPTGGAVIFSCSLLHEATDVTRGARYAFLPFFYDDDGARIREENAQFLMSPHAETREAAQG